MTEDAQSLKQTIDLEQFSVEELQERIVELQAQIEACEGELKKKQSHKSAADALFGTSD